MRVGDGDRQGIRRVRPRYRCTGQQARHHRMYLILRCIADAHHRFLDESRCIFADNHSGTRGVEQHHAARLPELQRRLRIGVDEHLLHRRAFRPVFEDQVGQRRIERQQACGQGEGGIGPDLPVGDMRQAVAVREDQAPAGCAETGIKAEDDYPSFSITSSEMS